MHRSSLGFAGLLHVASFVLLGTAGCALDPAAMQDADLANGGDDEQVDDDGAALTDGAVTFRRPEVGRVFVWKGAVSTTCTATLVAPRAVLLAAHCVDYASRAPDGEARGDFVVETGPERMRTFHLDGWISFGTKLGATDVALIHLLDAVPTEVAKPAEIAASKPSKGSMMSVFGYGCTDRSGRTNDGRKRVYFFEYARGKTNVLCPGDSGGPAFDDAKSKVVTVNSAIKNDSKWNPFDDDYDLYGDVVRFRAQITATVAAWR